MGRPTKVLHTPSPLHHQPTTAAAAAAAMEFERRKTAAMAALTTSDYNDKSPKGSLDAPIVPLIAAINRHPSLYTTSSCSGRISLLFHPRPSPSSSAATAKKKAGGGSWLFVSHDPVNPDSVVGAVFDSASGQGELVFRFEPFIVAVECRDVASAQWLVSTAIACGFRESGITNADKRIMVALRSSIRLEVPLGDVGHIMVSSEYVRYLVDIANAKMSSNKQRTDKLYDDLLSKGLVDLGLRTNKATSKEELVCSESSEGEGNKVGEDENGFQGSVGEPSYVMHAVSMTVVGEPVERLFRWGHAACVVDEGHQKQILLFGGFGGMGRHARQNDTLMLDPVSGVLKSIHGEILPPMRMGQTISNVGENVYLIGGRGDPAQIWNDVWVMHIATQKWELLHCSGSAFRPRHRHAAAVVGQKIYVFGGLNSDVVCSCLYILDTETLEWKEICNQGKDWPCARHSHSMVANEFELFVFGGYDGEKALGDLYSFDTRSLSWKEEKTNGQIPSARFSHSMFVCNEYLGILGGCPIVHNFQELALLDMKAHVWMHISVCSISKDLLVRATASVIGDELLIIGGGASCYAFGTKFNEPIKINLQPLVLADKLLFQLEETHVEPKKLLKNGNNLSSAKPLVLRLEKNYGKFGKDILKKHGWLDPGRRVYATGDGMYVCLPITEGFLTYFREKTIQTQDAIDISNILNERGISVREMPASVCLDVLRAFRGTVVTDDVVYVKKASISPHKVLREAVSSLIKHHGLPRHLLDKLPNRWEKLGDMIVLPVTSFNDPLWSSIGNQLWPLVADALGTSRLARQGKISPNGTRDSTLEILVGDSGWVSHEENGMCYSFDATKCMFSFGNLSEKRRMVFLDCSGEVVVDLFAGIGYFVLPFLVKAKAKLVYACEWNPYAIEALRRNVKANFVEDRCIILEGDNRLTAPKRVADRICLGLLPSSEGSWLTAVQALRSEGGVLHVHGNVKDSEEVSWPDYVAHTIGGFATSEGYNWDVTVQHVERVKWYAPHIRHLVVDIKCCQLLT